MDGYICNSTYVKSFDGETKWMYCFIKDDGLSKKK